MFVFQQVIDSILLEVLYRKVITTGKNNINRGGKLLEVLYRKVITTMRGDLDTYIILLETINRKVITTVYNENMLSRNC